MNTILTRVKICGITDQLDALRAAKQGAWALGFNFYKKSPRYVSAYKARKIIAALPPFVVPVGVFVNAKEGAVKDIARFCGLRVLQFHGDESPSYIKRFSKFCVIKAFRVGEDFDPEQVKAYKCGAYLFDAYQKDAYGGTGRTFDWSVVKKFKDLGTPVILSGGITPKNVREARDAVRPYAVDVASGVEKAPGVKDDRLIQDLMIQLMIDPE